MPVSARVAGRRYEELAAQAAETGGAWHALAAELKARGESVVKEGAAARRALALAYLPALTREAVDRAERLSGYRGFSQRDPFKAMDREADLLGRRVARLEADERYQRREYLVGPAGELTRGLAEARSMLEPWEQECRRFEGLEGFDELLRAGYDTPAFDVSWLSPSYWKCWAAGDRICAALGMDDFGDDVLPAFHKVDAERARWRGEVARWAAKVQEVHDLVQDHDRSQARLPHLDEEFLAQAREALAAHLERADPGLLEAWLGKDGEPDRGILVALRRVAGLRAKADALDQMESEARKVAASLAERAEKYRRKAEKTRRKGRSVPERALDPAFPEKARKLGVQREKALAAADRVVAYDRYDWFSLSNPPQLWWEEFTGRPPGRLTPRLRSWYDRHPDRRPARDRDDGSSARAVAAAAVAVETHADLGDLS